MIKRYVEIFIDGLWHQTTIQHVEDGDIFKLFESTGEQIGELWKAVGAPYYCDNNICGVFADPMELNELE